MGSTYTTAICSSCASNSSYNSTEFNIKQGDTCPNFTIEVRDPSTGQMASYEGWSVEVYMYFESCLRSDSGASNSYPVSIIRLLGNVNLCQVKIGDMIGVEDCNQNLQEFMLVTAIDYDTGEITVERGYGDSDIYTHKKGDKLIFYRIYGKSGYIDSKYEEDIEEGVEADFSILGYQWDVEDTSHRGKYFIELKATNLVYDDDDPSLLVSTQIRSFPVSSTDYIVNIV